jgi:hypothetical protein
MGEEKRGRSYRLYSRRRLMVVLTALGAMSFGAGLTLAVTGTGQPGDAVIGAPPQPATANRALAAAWIAQQVGSDVNVSCDPQMCGEVSEQGFPAARLTALPPRTDGPLGAGVVVATPTLQDQFGARLATVYAPLVLASFGSGAEQVDIRVVAPDGAAALRAQLAAEHTHLVAAGTQLLRNSNIAASPAARAPLLAGQVDPRLLVMLSALASQGPVRLVTFDDSSPGTSTVVQLRGAEIGAASTAGLSAVLGFLRAQQAPYLPASAAIARAVSGQSVVTVRYDAPGPMDLGGS